MTVSRQRFLNRLVEMLTRKVYNEKKSHRCLSAVFKGALTQPVLFMIVATTSACDNPGYIGLVAMQPKQVSRAEMIREVDTITKDAGLKRVRDWSCSDANSGTSVDSCAPGTVSEAFYQGKGQVIAFAFIKSHLLFCSGGIIGSIFPPTRDDYIRLNKVLSVKFGTNYLRGSDAVAACNGLLP
jgi:hypothetical protein